MGSEARARLGLAGLLVATLFACEQLFVNADYFGPALVAVVAASATTMLARRLGAGSWLTLVASLAGLLWYLALVFQASSTLFGLPTAAAGGALADSVALALRASRVDFAPIPVRPGYVILVVVGMWTITVLGELATFRWRRPLIASLLPVGLFSFLLIVGHRGASELMVTLFLAALLSYLGLESSHELRAWGRWVPTWRDEDGEPRAVTGRVARRMGASCLLAGLVLPFLLPSFGGGLLAWRNQSGEGPGAGGSGGIDLLVSLVPENLEQTDRELFRVEASEPGYWRLVSLANFDGTTWRPIETGSNPASTGFSEDIEARYSSERQVSQSFELTGLEGDYLPAAVRPEFLAIDSDDAGRDLDDVSVSQEGSDLSIDGGLLGLGTYRVESDVPDVTYKELARTSVGDTPQAQVYSEAPELDPEVVDLLEGWVGNLSRDFTRLVAIQEELRSFEYSTDVEADASSDYLTTFLTTTRRGYCQQFATAFALLARSLGYPTRVSVGFLPGQRTAEDDLYIVRGTHAHAWPEVFFDGVGWIPFEPTPRSIATVPGYTVAPAGTAAAGGAGAGGDAPGSGVNRADIRAGAPPGSTVIQQQGGPSRAGGQDPRTLVLGRDRSAGWEGTFKALVLVLIALVIAFLVAVPTIKETVSARRYRRARGPDEAAIAAYTNFTEDAAELAFPRRRSESAAAYAERIVEQRAAASEAVARLAAIYEAAEYRAGGVSADQADEARGLASRLRRSLWAQASWWERGVRLFGPARVLGRVRGSLGADLS